MATVVPPTAHTLLLRDFAVSPSREGVRSVCWGPEGTQRNRIWGRDAGPNWGPGRLCFTHLGSNWHIGSSTPLRPPSCGRVALGVTGAKAPPRRGHPSSPDPKDPTPTCPTPGSSASIPSLPSPELFLGAQAALNVICWPGRRPRWTTNTEHRHVCLDHLVASASAQCWAKGRCFVCGMNE